MHLRIDHTPLIFGMMPTLWDSLNQTVYLTAQGTFPHGYVFTIKEHRNILEVNQIDLLLRNL